MKKILFITLLLIILCGCNKKPEENTKLWDKLIDVTIQHIKTNGPDEETGQFLSMTQHYGWSRRQEFVNLVVPYLKVEDPDNIAGAINILFWLRVYRPMTYLGDFEKDNYEFFAELDKTVCDQLEHIHSLKSDKVYRYLALYLGCLKTAESKRNLLRIANSSIAIYSKDQALICLTFHRDPNDMDSLLSFMLEDSFASSSLPYHFRISYGNAAIPYLKKAMAEAKHETTRREAEKELQILLNKKQ